MVDLGQYTAVVLSAYAGTIVCLLALIFASVARSRRVARRLTEVEARRGKGAGKSPAEGSLT
ncbi:heme exporter protein CcmD [Gymnodinialimonas ceratoperidinii]|nr:heme exporter protein CcmD [Gymnodinialimonas ceratoperidinii]